MAAVIAFELATQFELDNFDIPELIEELICEERIVEVEYSLPSLPGRAKSFLLPAGTVINKNETPSYGKALKKIREIRGLTVEQLSRKMGLDSRGPRLYSVY